jgi:two-component system chemotaxis sensor kinase CheA
VNGFSEEEIRQLKEAFVIQSQDLLEGLNAALLEFEKFPGDEALLQEINRITHTLKGDARSIGLSSLADLAHRAEDLLVSISEKRQSVNRDIVSVLFRCADQFQQILQKFQSGSEESVDLAPLFGELDQFLSSSEKETEVPSDTFSEYVRLQIESARKEGKNVLELAVRFDERCEERKAGAFLVHKKISALGQILFSDPPLDGEHLNDCDEWRLWVASRSERDEMERAGRVPGVVAEFRTVEHETPGEAAERRSGEDRRKSVLGRVDQILRVDSQRVDEMMNLVGELIVSRSAIIQYTSELEERYQRDETVGRLTASTTVMERTLSDLQKSVMKIRMVPIDQVFRRFPRVVRDLTQENGKEIGLEIFGKETELDKSLVDVVGEPILHLVRNAIDHGIENKNARVQSGKPASGTITLKAFHEGNQVVIEVGDDGGGIDRNRLKQKVVEKNLMTEKDVAKLADQDVLDLIFLPGLSTASRVTEVSGRGIGMDVVKTTIEKLNGVIDVRSEPESGTKFSLKLPLTLAIIRAMMFEVKSRRFALPMSSILEIFRTSTELLTVHGKPVFNYRGRIISLIDLTNMFGIDRADGDGGRVFVIVVGVAEKRLGLVVDNLIGEEELVIKPLDDQWVPSKAMAGASILGDGRIVLILDAPSLVQEAVGKDRDASSAEISLRAG